MILDKRAEALAWLKKAVARGYGLTEIQHDPDFTSLLGEPAFQKLPSLAPTSTTASPATGEKK
jgi:hypothetical protein